MKKNRMILTVLLFFLFLLPIRAETGVYSNPDTGYTVYMMDQIDLLSSEEEEQLIEDMKPITTYGNVAFISARAYGDDTGSYAALAHCGWRGVVKGLAQKAAQALLTQNPHLRLNAWLGPHIQACCFEVQEDVAAQFPANCVLRKKDKIYVDLNIEIKRQLTQAGVAAEKIQTPYYCTCGDKENFFSWRRDHEKNMLLSFLYKP